MYIEKKKIGNNVYNYLKESFRDKNKVKTRTVAYLGKGDMDKKEIQEKVNELKKKLEINEKFLTKEQIERLEDIKKEFSRKTKNADKKLVADMFKDFKTFYIYNTNAIEGNTLTLEETNLLLNEKKTPEGKELREIYDHINEKDTFDFIVTNKPNIDNKIIIKLHHMLMDKIDKRTGFRLHKVRVFGANFETSLPEYIKADMNILLRWYNKNKKVLHPIVLASIFHEKFERIHPFYDGNGRTGRMLINLILIKKNLPPLIIRNKDRKEYYHVLNKGHKAGLDKTDSIAYKPIVEFCYKQLISTYERIFSKWV
jgi:Fic family protein